MLVIELLMVQHLDGIALASLARRRLIDVPVLFISDRPDELARAADFRPPHACLEKPFRMSRMLDAVRRFQTFIL